MATAESILEDHNVMHLKINYKMEIENNQHISFLEFNIDRNTNENMLGIHGKPKQTDIVIHRITQEIIKWQHLIIC
jgi:hypothetical protein